MAEVLPKALRQLSENTSRGDGCELERDFAELYTMLGDREAQDRIRAKTPQGPHCPKLRANAKACIGCDNNPHESAARKTGRKIVEDAGILIREAFRLHDLAEFGLLEHPTPTELEILRIVHQAILADRMRDQADIIAARVSQIFCSSSP